MGLVLGKTDCWIVITLLLCSRKTTVYWQHKALQLEVSETTTVACFTSQPRLEWRSATKSGVFNVISCFLLFWVKIFSSGGIWKLSSDVIFSPKIAINRGIVARKEGWDSKTGNLSTRLTSVTIWTSYLPCRTLKKLHIFSLVSKLFFSSIEPVGENKTMELVLGLPIHKY